MTLTYSFDYPHDKSATMVRDMLGGKGANLAVMASELALPVPPGFTISTETCLAYLSDGWPDELDDEIRAQLGRIEEAIGRKFGSPRDPLLLSVRSGAAISMPGMMDTILDLGLNDATTRGLAEVSGDELFARACRDRFEAMYRQIVDVSEVPEDPWEQLCGAIEAVFRSWNSDRARSYRAHEGISDELGTGVTVQTMVFGNRGADSGAGVVFTRNPATGERGLYGDVLFDSQGEDVVAGTHTPEPITVLDERLPVVARELRGYCDVLEQHYADLCDVEFTIEQAKLWMLQVRIGKRTPQAALRIAIEMAEDGEFPLSRVEAVQRVVHHLEDPPTMTAERSDGAPRLTRAMGASPGLVSGKIATTPDAVVEMADEGHAVILVRKETSPDDVHGMARAAGILTVTGGLASHAAVVARGWGIPAVVGAKEVAVGDGTVSIGGLAFGVGDLLTIDGASGEVFAGAVDGSVVPVPEAAKLLAWARELGIEIGESDETNSEVVATDETIVTGDGPTADTIVRALLIKGVVTVEMLAPAVVAGSEDLGPVLDEMSADGLIGDSGGLIQLTDEGKALGLEMMAADRDAWRVDNASAALDAFVPLDQRMKEVVTAWQMSEVDGKPVLNDHSDGDYDAAVLERLASLHQDAAAWLESMFDGLPRLEDYSSRLHRAAKLVAEGDHGYIASPRVDSYHSIWFELHEDLILLAGRSREDEVAAGRA
ncbi:MAG: pyruvate, phosphate dikinase [Acidimicrobiia bacterium]